MTYTVTLGTRTISFTKDDVLKSYERSLIDRFAPGDVMMIIHRFIIANEPSNAFHQHVDKERILQWIPRHLSKEELRFLILRSYAAAEMIERMDMFIDNTPTAFLPLRMQRSYPRMSGFMQAAYTREDEY